MKGNFAATNLLIAMLPEELLLDKVIEALQVYKLAGGDKPRAEVIAILQKWASEGLSPEEIIAYSKKAEDVYRVGKQMTDLDEN